MNSTLYLYRASITLSLLSCIGLSGCASALHAVVSPAFSSATESAGESMAFNNATPATYGISPDLYRGHNCEQLALYKASSEKERSKPGAERMLVQLYGFEIDAYAQVEREKGCLTTESSGTKVAPVVAATAVPSGSSKIAAVSPTTPTVQGIGALTETDVRDLANFRASDCKRLVDVRQRQAQRAGEIDSQLAADAAEMRKQSDRDRYLQIQRETAAVFKRQLVLLELAWREKSCDGTASSVAATAQIAPVIPRKVMQVPSAVPAAPPLPRESHCFAMMHDIDKGKMVLTELWKGAPALRSLHELQATLSRFIETMQQRQPGLWNNDFSVAQCVTPSGWSECTSTSARLKFWSVQAATLHCTPSAETFRTSLADVKGRIAPDRFQLVDFTP